MRAVAGSAAWGVTACTVSTMTSWINLNIDSRLFIVWTGIFNRTNDPHITHLKPTANGQEMSLISIEEMYSFARSTAWLVKPMTVRPKNQLQIQVLTDATIGGVPSEAIGLVGVSVATRSYLIRAS